MPRWRNAMRLDEEGFVVGAPWAHLGDVFGGSWDPFPRTVSAPKPCGPIRVDLLHWIAVVPPS